VLFSCLQQSSSKSTKLLLATVTSLGMYQISVSIRFRLLTVNKWTMKPSSLLILLTHYFVHYSLLNIQLNPLLHPRFKPGHHKLKHATCDHPHSCLDVRVKQVLSPNYWVITQTIYNCSPVSPLNSVNWTVNVSYVTIRYPLLTGSGWIADSTIRPLSVQFQPDNENLYPVHP